jgi:hypothetical protein
MFAVYRTPRTSAPVRDTPREIVQTRSSLSGVGGSRTRVELLWLIHHQDTKSTKKRQVQEPVTWATPFGPWDNTVLR